MLALIHIAFAAYLAPVAPPGRDRLPAPSPPGRVAVEARVRWNVWVPLSYRVWWTALEHFDGPPPADACTAVVPPEAPPPAGWTPTGLGGTRQGWTMWTNARC